MSRCILIAALALAGCSPQERPLDGDAAAVEEAAPAVDTCNISFRLDATLSTDQRAAIGPAFAMWNGVTTRQQLCVRDSGARTVRVIPDQGLEWQALLAESAGHVAFIGLARPTEIVVVDGLTPEEFRRTIQHEAGHVLGLGHVLGPPAVMSPAELYGSSTLTAADIAECRRVGACA